MSEAILVALITGGLSLLGVIVTSRKSAREMEHKLEVQQAVTQTEIKELTREVREHNGYTTRVPALENDVKALKETVKELQKYHMEKG